MNNTYQNYLQDLVFTLRERSIEAKDNLDRSAEHDKAFHEGYLAAYTCILSNMKNQFATFNIEDEFNLSDFDPENELWNK